MEKVREGLQRRARRMQENIQQSVGLSEKKDELQSVSHVEQRNQKMIAAVKNTRQNLQNSIKSVNKEETIDKRKRRMDEYVLWVQLQADAKELENVFPRSEPSVLANVLRLYSDAIGVILEEKVLTDQLIEKSVFDVFTKYIDEEKALSKAKEKLARTVLDVEVCRKRRQAYHDEAKAQELQDGYDALQLKLENYKDSVFTDIFSLLSKETEIASVFKDLIIAQMEYHRTALQKYENVLPEIDRKIASYPRRPVFGCHLEDHLCYSNRSIALVLEVCCSLLKYQGFSEKVSCSNYLFEKIIAFDAHQMNGTCFELSEYFNDPHSVCSVLKCYLRELPEPLMTHAVHYDWVQVAKMDSEMRKDAIRQLLPLLPESNRLNLAFLIRFLQLMLNYENQTMMGVGNLSIVFGPNLIDAGLDAESDNIFGSKLVETLISNADLFFPNDHFTFTSPLVDVCVQKATIGFSSERSSMKSNHGHPSTQESIHSNVAKQTSQPYKYASSPLPPARVRPKWPAPPPPVSTMSTDTCDEMSPGADYPSTTSKSPSIASSDSALAADYNSSCCTNVEISDAHFNHYSHSPMMVRSMHEPSRTTVASPVVIDAKKMQRSVSAEKVYICGCASSSSSSSDPATRPLPPQSSSEVVKTLSQGDDDEMPRRLVTTGTRDNNHRTLVRLEPETFQGSATYNGTPLEASIAGAVKPPLPAKPKPLVEAKPNEVTKL